MPRPKVSEEHRRQKKREADRRYYERHREELLVKARQKYDPDVQKVIYAEHGEEIRERNREAYHRRRVAGLRSRLEDLKTAVSGTYRPLVEFALKQNLHERLFTNEITLIENLLLLATAHEPPKNEIIIPDAGDFIQIVGEKPPPPRIITEPRETPTLIITEINEPKERTLEEILARPKSQAPF